MNQDACVTLQSGERFSGKVRTRAFKSALGEVVFNTGMVGYVESLTDPSYAGQILVFTYPLIGNYGVPDPSTWESDKIQVKGVVFSELAPFYSHPEAIQSLEAWLSKEQIPFITEVDTRALTKALRSHGVIPGAITLAHETPDHFEDFEHQHWVAAVSPKKPIEYHPDKPHTIIAIDCGMKANILRCLERYPYHIKRVPYDYDFTNEQYDGIFISNGPGDPKQCDKTIQHLKIAMQQSKPIFGICLGTQLMALAANADTYKLRFGHRSHNQPCLHLPTGHAYLTSQNHGYAIDEKSLSADWEVLFKNLNDQTIAGIRHRTKPFFSVQFHPEAAPGPEDTQWLFEAFYQLIKTAIK